MEGDGERFDEGPVSQGKCVGERQDLSGWQNDVLCKATVAAFSDEAEVPAQVFPAGAAGLAGSAADP
ncbi:hypothetical protein GCM10007866_22920 [Gluconobacter albidus]|uniref:Uncharacterized protein n=1 Tax=Gluconobacter albidus TaxID=318683 RepID=A0ABQ5X4X0_9PROT|nr:hypothetical protein GCM10007866_22920 [Gluconobacter albidus]